MDISSLREQLRQITDLKEKYGSDVTVPADIVPNEKVRAHLTTHQNNSSFVKIEEAIDFMKRIVRAAVADGRYG